MSHRQTVQPPKGVELKTKPNGESNPKYVDLLEEDKPIAGQKFVCLSFVSPEGLMNCNTRGIKIRGTYNTYEQAKKACELLNKKDKYFEIFFRNKFLQ